MPPEQVPPPPTEEQVMDEGISSPSVDEKAAQSPATTIVRPHVRFSPMRWITTGIIRLIYRRWTRIAARIFPENSTSERIAQKIHVPLPDKLNLSWVNDHLAVGGRIRPEDIRALELVGVTHVVDTRAEHCDDVQALARAHIELLHLPTPDTYPLTVEQLMQGAKWVTERTQEGGRVLIHCEHGVGRSVLLTCAALVYSGMHASDALLLVMRKRWQAAPNHRQVERLRTFEAALVAQQQGA